jgi:hypothetical protein
VVVVGMAGLRWTDVTRNTMPSLAALADTGSVGTLSVRAAPSVTCPAEGWLTLGSGTYAATRDPGEIVPAEGCAARPVPRVTGRDDGGAHVPTMTELVGLNRELRFGADPGWLADRLGCVAAVGDGAAVAAAAPDGEVTHYRAALPADLSRLLTRCPATLVDGGAVPESGARHAALRRVDRLLARIRAALPPRTVLMVLGVAETDAEWPRLHAAVVGGPGFGFGYLDSTSTRRVPYVQLADVAPTILEVLSHPFPDSVAGRPFTGESGDRPYSLDATRRRLADTDRRAVEQRHVLGWFFGGLGLVVALVASTLVRVRVRSASARVVGVLRVTAVGLSGVPAAVFLANLLPWWRTANPALAVSAAVVLWTAAILGVALIVARAVEPGARRVRAQVGVVASVTLSVFAADALTGSWLQMDSLLGYNPLVAGRFTGFGNIAFAALGAGAVILASLLAHGKARSRALGALAVVALPVLALDGWPAWGADFGGVLTLVPTFVVLGLLVTRTRLTGPRLALAAGVGVALVGAICWLDYLRPASSRSHFGRFLGTVLSGGGQGHGVLEVVERKLLASWELLFMGPHTVAALGLTAGLVLMVFRPPAFLRRGYQAHGMLRPMLYSTVALALFGFATNDSGIAIPAVITLVTGPATLALCATEAAPARAGS